MKLKFGRILAGIAVAFLVAIFLLKSSTLALKQITLKDNKFTPKEKIRPIVAPYYGHSLLIPLYINSLRSKLLMEFVHCEDVVVRPKSLHSLELRFVEKKPWASFWVEGKTILVASDGSVLGASDADMSDYNELIIVRGFPEMYFQEKRIPEDFVQHIHEVLNSLKRYMPGTSFQLQYQDRYNWIILYQDTLPIYIGVIQNLDDKFHRLQSFLQFYNSQVEQKPIEYIDLRSDKKILVKYGEPS